MELETGKLTGFEALLRWHHPEWGIMCPIEFISAAEETGLIVSIGYWVIGEVCRQLSIWQNDLPADRPLTTSVNLI